MGRVKKGPIDWKKEEVRGHFYYSLFLLLLASWGVSFNSNRWSFIVCDVLILLFKPLCGASDQKKYFKGSLASFNIHWRESRRLAFGNKDILSGWIHSV